MNLGNPWLHSNSFPEVLGTRVAFVQLPQNANTSFHPVQIQQPLYNSPSSALSKRLSPFETSNPLEKRLKLVDGGFLVEMAPQNSFHHPNTTSNIQHLGGFFQPAPFGRENGTINQPIIIGDLSSFKPSLSIPPINLKQLENSALGNFVTSLAPQALPSYEAGTHLGFNNLIQQLPIEGNQILLQNPIQAPSGFLNMLPQQPIQVMAALHVLNLQPQAHNNTPLNVYQQQNYPHNNLPITPNFNIQQIQISSLNVQPIIFPEPSLNINNNVVIEQQPPSYKLRVENDSQIQQNVKISPKKVNTLHRPPPPREEDLPKTNQEKKSPLIFSETKIKTSSMKEDDIYSGEKPSKESLSTTSNSEQNEIEEEPKSAESFVNSLVTINLRNPTKKSATDFLRQRNKEDKTKSSKELDKIIQRQTKEELAFVTRRRENLERRKNRWQVAQEEEKVIIEQQPQPQPQTVLVDEPETTEQKVIQTPVGPMNQIQLPPFFEEDVARSRLRDSQLKWDPEAIKAEEFESLVIRVGEILKINNVNNEKLTRLLRQNDYDVKKTIEMVQENTKRYVQCFLLRQKKLKMRY